MTRKVFDGFAELDSGLRFNQLQTPIHDNRAGFKDKKAAVDQPLGRCRQQLFNHSSSIVARKKCNFGFVLANALFNRIDFVFADVRGLLMIK